MKYISPRRKTIALLAYAMGGVVVALTAMMATYAAINWSLGLSRLIPVLLFIFGLMAAIPTAIAFYYPSPTVGLIGGLLGAVTYGLTMAVAAFIGGHLSVFGFAALGLWALFAVPAVITAQIARRWRRIAGPDRCYSCGYLLIGLTEPRCPECGQSFDPCRVPRAPVGGRTTAVGLGSRWVRQGRAD